MPSIPRHIDKIRALIAIVVAVPLFTLAQPAPDPARATTQDFVTRSGSTLMLDGRPFRFFGTNMYWLQLDDNVRDRSGDPTYPTKFRIDDAMTTAQAMGGTVVRAWANSVGCERCLQPSLGRFNADAFDSLDYAVASAARHNQRLILSLVDNWPYYHGGKTTYTTWRGRPESAFFADPTVIQDYLRHIDVVTSHVNRYTGVAYKDDPTIMAWQTGNEMWCQTCAGNYWDGSWTKTVADHLKRVAPRQLVVDGHGTDPSCTAGCLHEPSLDFASVDIVDDHHYPMTVARVRSAAATAKAHRKAYLVGEYDWVNHTGGDSLSAFHDAIVRSGAAGDIMWAVMPHADDTGFVDHDDGFQYFYPGRNADEVARTKAMVAHAARISGKWLDTKLFSPEPVQASALHVPGEGVRVTWRGASRARDYTVQRRHVSSAAWTTMASRITDQRVIHGPTWTDTSTAARWSGEEYVYRVVPAGLTGAAGASTVTATVRAK